MGNSLNNLLKTNRPIVQYPRVEVPFTLVETEAGAIKSYLEYAKRRVLYHEGLERTGNEVALKKAILYLTAYRYLFI